MEKPLLMTSLHTRGLLVRDGEAAAGDVRVAREMNVKVVGLSSQRERLVKAAGAKQHSVRAHVRHLIGIKVTSESFIPDSPLAVMNDIIARPLPPD